MISPLTRVGNVVFQKDFRTEKFIKSYTWTGNSTSIALDHHRSSTTQEPKPRVLFTKKVVQTFNNRSENLRFNSAFGIINTDDIDSTLQ